VAAELGRQWLAPHAEFAGLEVEGRRTHPEVITGVQPERTARACDAQIAKLLRPDLDDAHVHVFDVDSPQVGARGGRDVRVEDRRG
jgi:hypothetical protein